MPWQEKLTERLSEFGIEGDASGKIVELVAGWVGGDFSKIADALVTGLDDDKLDSKDSVKLIATIVELYGKPSDPFIKDLLDHLKDGVLSTDDLGEIAGVWAASRVADPNLQTLIKSAFQGHLNTNDIKEALIGYVNDQKGDEAAEMLRAILDGSHKLTLQSAVLIAVAYFAKAKITVGSSIQDQIAAIQEALDELQKSELAEILVAMVKDDYALALKLILKSLDILADQTLIERILAGEVGPILHDELLNFIKRSAAGIDDDQAKALADFIAGLFTGKTVLIAEEDDRAETGLGKKDYRDWLRVRRVIFAAIRAANGGPTIPISADAPHSFVALGNIGFNTPVKEVIAADKRDMFILFTHSFARAEFKTNFKTFFRPKEFDRGVVFGFIYDGIMNGLSA